MDNTTTESAGAILAKLAPPASVTVASVAGMQISDIVLWATLIYTLLMIVHKMISMAQEITAWRHAKRNCKCGGDDGKSTQ